MTTMNGTAQATADPWEAYFGSLDPAARAAHQAHWQRLTGLQQTIAASHTASGLGLGEVERLLGRAAERLDLLRPYRVVVVGETGAGKSSLINACFGRPLQKAMSGGAVTGTATYIFPDADVPVETARVVFRSDPEFGELIAMLGRRYGLALPVQLEELEAFLARPTLPEAPGQRLPDHIREQVLHDVGDIVRTWRALRDANRLGEVLALKRFDPELLARMVEEDGDRTAGSAAGAAPREVPGVARAEIYLPGRGGPESLRHVVLVDTPGLGARRLRHREVMQLEIARADAVILVVNAERPVKQGEALDAILRHELFHGYTDDERNAFAAKVFLVVNRYDRIQKTEERQLLAASIEEIAGTIAPDYLARYGLGAADQRYFQISADAGYLARRLAEGEALSSEDERRFRSYVPLLGDGQVGDAGYQAGWEASKLPQLLAALQRFLARERLQLSLGEAERDLKAAARGLRDACRERLSDQEVSVEGFAQASQALAEHRRRLCAQLLRDDQRALRGAFRQMVEALHGWRRRPDLGEGLVRTVTAIYQDLGATVQAELARLAEPADDGAAMVSEVYDDVSGSTYTEARVYALLLQVEHRLRGQLEQASDRLAGYYLDALAAALASSQVYEKIGAAGYGQPYIKDLDPAGALARSSDQVGAEYRQICRSALLYELIQRPILLPKSAADSAALWKAVASVAPRIAEEGVTALMESVGLAGGLARLARANIGTLVDQLAVHAPGSPLAAHAPGNPLAIPEAPLMAERQLVEEIVELLRRREVARCQQIVSEQFALRVQIAIGMALATLESLFFYQVGKFRRTLEDQAAQIERLHLAHITIPGGAGSSIVETLLGRRRPELSQMQRLVETLAVIDPVVGP